MMKPRAAVLCFIVILTALLPGGCWDANEINTLSIVAGVGIDAGQNEDEFDVTVQIRKVSNPTEDTPDQPFLLMDATGSNVLGALRDIELRNNRDLFLHHNQLLVISSELAECGIRPLLDMFLRDHESRLEVWVIISNVPARELLGVQLVQEPVTASALALMMEQQSNISQPLATNMLSVTSTLLDASKALVIPAVGIKDEFGDAKVVIQGSAVFVSDKLAGRLDKNETLGYALATGDVHSGLMPVTAEGGSAVLYISDASPSMKPVVTDGQIKMNINIDATLSVAEITGFNDEKLPDVFEKLETAGRARILELVGAAFKKSLSLGADIFGLGNALHQNNPKEWDKVKADWKNQYLNTVLNLTVNARITETGKISDALTMKGEE
jgi:spore germination protein KC